MSLEISMLEEALRKLLGLNFGKESVSNMTDSHNPKFLQGTIIRKSDIAITIRHGEVTKKYERSFTQHAIF